MHISNKMIRKEIRTIGVAASAFLKNVDFRVTVHSPYKTIVQSAEN